MEIANISISSLWPRNSPTLTPVKLGGIWISTFCQIANFHLVFTEQENHQESQNSLDSQFPEKKHTLWLTHRCPHHQREVSKIAKLCNACLYLMYCVSKNQIMLYKCITLRKQTNLLFAYIVKLIQELILQPLIGFLCFFLLSLFVLSEALYFGSFEKVLYKWSS